MNSLSFNHVQSDRIEINLTDGSPIASYLFDEKLPKPCFHPLCTAAGHQITGFETPDHIWHRGLWFAIRFVNQSNFWEEHPPFGIQKTEGQPRCELTSPDALRIAHELIWTSEATGPAIREQRTITVTALSNGIRQIDWTTTLEAVQDLLLDRTPYTTWGGYGGLAFRAALQVQGVGFLQPDGKTATRIAGQPNPWSLFRGIVGNDPNSKISLGMIDHPDNPRSPMPWYCRTEEGYDVMYAAFLFHEPMTLAKGRQIALRHRVIYRDGWWEADEFNQIADAFQSGAG